jgi:N-acetylglucosaminyl-diphospho-decaprenol L-rhamnosyltransferase
VTQPSDTGIVIVTYNSAAEIGPCLEAAMKTGADVVVVDNASSDGTITEVERRRARLIANNANLGFAAAVNQGFRALRSRYVLLLNPDAVLQSGLDALRDASDLPGSAGAGGLLLGADGRPQVGFMVRKLPTPAALILEALVLNRIWPGNPVNRSYRGLGLNYSERFAAEQPAGAFLMVRRAVWEELGGFDEEYHPIWFEDVDFCRRVADRGWRLYFTPAAVAKHTGGHSIPRLPVEKRRLYWYRSLLRYTAKHFHPFAIRTVSLAVIWGSVLRAVVQCAHDMSLKPMADCGNVVRLAGRCLMGGRGDGAGLSGSKV